MKRFFTGMLAMAIAGIAFFGALSYDRPFSDKLGDEVPGSTEIFRYEPIYATKLFLNPNKAIALLHAIDGIKGAEPVDEGIKPGEKAPAVAVRVNNSVKCNLEQCSYTADSNIAAQHHHSIAVGFGNMGGYPDWYGGNYICTNNNLHLGVVEGSGITQAPNDDIFLYPVKHSYKSLYELQLNVESKALAVKEHGLKIVHVFVDDLENDVQVGMVELNDETIKAFRRYVSSDDRIRFIQEPYEQL